MRLILSLLSCSILFAQPPKVVSSKISYFGSHFMHDWVGISESVKTDFSYNELAQTGSVRVSVMLESFDSKLSSRDSNMLFYTEAIDYPEVIFKSTKIAIQADSAYIEGELTFHGITKKLATSARMFTKENPQISGSFSVNLSDYNVERPSLLFVKIDDEIRIEYSFAIE